MNISYGKHIVLSNKQVSEGIYKLTISGSFKGAPGQFYMLKCSGEGALLPRPISIYDIDENSITFLYNVVGKGTKALCKLEARDSIEMHGPLGNGFSVENLSGKVAVVTGGIGIAPMFYTIRSIKNCTVDLYSGFRSDIYEIDNLNKYVNKTVISTENGQVGSKGYITNVFKPEDYDVVLCCGPEAMMNRVILMCREKRVPVYVSMEKHMACGIGACLVCTCKTKGGNKRTCKDGPVFLGEEIVLDA
jgi:dihydroorotate dehydrogenase electron transfer subunit